MTLPTLAKQMALRTSSILIVKLLGFFARIPLFRILGPEGIGRYQMVYAFYVLLLTFITSGFPTVLALTTANDRNQGWRFFKIISVLFVLLGGIASFLCFTYAPALARMLGDSDLTFAIRCVAPTLLIVPFLSLIRSLLQGVEAYGRIAVSELIEQIFRVAIMLALVVLWVTRGSAIAVSGAMLGTFVGALAALIFLVLAIAKRPVEGLYREKKFGIFAIGRNIRQLFHDSYMISLSRFLIPISDFLDALIIPRRLQDAGLSFSHASALYGEMTGMAATIIYMPLIFTAALTHTLAAKLSSDWRSMQYTSFFRRMRLALHIGWIWGVGSGVVLLLSSEQLSMLLYGTTQAATGIRYLAIIPLIAGMREISTLILWSIGRRKEPFNGLLLGTCCNLLLGYVLVGLPGFGREGIAIGMISFELLALMWNLVAIRKYMRKMT
ncbi:oligosaccharide flippase family protein [Paenibacillus sp. N1-5-1-14]|uniref:oligosaccharide flippase family protein n=1 Tax=Paenibacillus radicibacter TaxID=2972488 RepID=UPI002159A17F|nr:oligosaccharide flippase family protein [Paenibacillus radicibacter]MCR8644999.1 oligosaccharide flippase family protein [Paenibacillus radicibacter]